jgi:hypothetical protein
VGEALLVAARLGEVMKLTRVIGFRAVEETARRKTDGVAERRIESTPAAMFDLRGLGMFATMCSHAAIGSIGFSPWRVYLLMVARIARSKCLEGCRCQSASGP